VLERLRAAIVGLSLVPGMALSSAMPMEHWHEAGPHHAHSTIHPYIDVHDHDGAEVSPTEGRVTWAEQVAVQGTGFRCFAPMLVPAALALDPDRPTRWIAIEAVDAAPAHGPPRPGLSLRGPPQHPAFFV
jgi:hypothetical protein